MAKQASIKLLIEKIAQLTKRVERLEHENTILREKLAKYEHPKNSRNSSIPPSKDENRPKRNQSLREKSNRKPGGQKGHKGATLTMVEVPDEIKKLIPDYCNCCGNDLRETEALLVSKRQVVELPPIKPIYIEYQSYTRKCTCGYQQTGEYPPHVSNHIQYGSSVEAAIGYYSVYQYLPFKRMSEMFTHVFNLPISQGSPACAGCLNDSGKNHRRYMMLFIPVLPKAKLLVVMKQD